MKASNHLVFFLAVTGVIVESRLAAERRENNERELKVIPEYKREEYCENICDDLFAELGSCIGKTKSIPYGLSDCFCTCNNISGGGFRTVTTITREDFEAQNKDLSEFVLKYIQQWKKDHPKEKRQVATDKDLRNDFKELLETVWTILKYESFKKTPKTKKGSTQGGARSLQGSSIQTDIVFPNPGTIVPCTEDPNCRLISNGLGPHIPPGTAELFDIPGTCRSRNRDWIRTGSDVLEFNAERIRQRYAMTVFFCEEDGGDWLEDDMWLSDLHECDWYNKIGLDPCNRVEQMEMIRIHG